MTLSAETVVADRLGNCGFFLPSRPPARCLPKDPFALKSSQETDECGKSLEEKHTASGAECVVDGTSCAEYHLISKSLAWMVPLRSDLDFGCAKTSQLRLEPEPFFFVFWPKQIFGGESCVKVQAKKICEAP
eukprot:s873_g1.t1